MAINVENFKKWAFTDKAEKIGKAENLREEVLEAVNHCATYAFWAAKVQDCLDGTKFTAVEVDAELFEKYRSKLIASIRRATSKILWLNTMAREATGEGFIDERIDRSDLWKSACLIMEFYQVPYVAEAEARDNVLTF